MPLLVNDADIQRALETSPTVAVLGAHDDPFRPAHYVPDYLFRKGYRILPVNPTKVGKVLWGEPVRATLAGVGVVDMVDVFRRSEDLPQHLEELLALAPKYVWLQLGIRNAAVVSALVQAGIGVVEDRCTLQDHRHFGLGRPVARD